MKLIGYGRKFYDASGSWIGVLYHEDNVTRSDWGKVEIALENGEAVSIRPPTDAEYGVMCKALDKVKADQKKLNADAV